MAPGDTDRLPPDPVIEYYKKDIDRTLLRENLKLRGGEDPEAAGLRGSPARVAAGETPERFVKAPKQAAGRPRDLNVVAELEALLEERELGSGKA